MFGHATFDVGRRALRFHERGTACTDIASELHTNNQIKLTHKHPGFMGRKNPAPMYLFLRFMANKFTVSRIFAATPGRWEGGQDCGSSMGGGEICAKS